jgi:glyoxylase-like metal-dependent hydrolase (beta-lactamase superfamily II)
MMADTKTIECFTVGPIGTNCYLLLDEETKEAFLVDPGDEAEYLISELNRREVRLRAVLLTHGHFDHICSLDTLRDKTGVPAYIHKGDADMPADSHKNAFSIFFGQEHSYRAPEKILGDGDVLTLGDEQIRVLHTPGHTEGSVCFLCGEKILITGDTLFDRGFGRYDLYGGDPLKLRRSLKRLSLLDRSLTIYAGHGCPTDLEDAVQNCALL